MKIIRSTNGRDIKVDDQWYDRLMRWVWYVNRGGPYGYACRGAYIRGKKRNILMHRVVMGAKKGQIVDHINHDTLDNRLENLRLCTHSQNHHNSKPYYTKNGFGPYPGVRWEPDQRKWSGLLTINGKRYRKRFKTMDEAIMFRKEMEKLVGDFLPKLKNPCR